MASLNDWEIVTSLGGMSAILLAASGFIAKIFMEKTKAKFQADIEQLKHSFQQKLSSLEQHNAISKDTYQNLFEERIKLYQNLTDAFEKYDSTIKEDYALQYDPSGGYDLYDVSFLNLSYQVRDLIKYKPLLISSELAKSYKGVFSLQHGFFRTHKHMDHEQTPPDEYHDMVAKLRSETEAKLMSLYEVIEKDIEKLQSPHLIP